jgi:predicted DNA-binding transcriptional regulator AlpA
MKIIIQIWYNEIKIMVSVFKTFLRKKLKRLLLALLRYDKDEYLTRKQTARFLKISVTTLWRLDRKQTLPATRFFGRVLYLKSDLLNYLERAA